MAHEIESMAYAGATPWHRLGKKVEGDATRNGSDFMVAAGMDWEAHKKPLYIKDDNGDFQVTQDSFAVIRNTDNKYLGTVGAQWDPIQPKFVFDWFQPIVDKGFALYETAGSLRDGRVIFALAKLTAGQGEVVKGDNIERYCLLSTSFDGTLSTRCGFTNVRVVCANTLAIAHDRKNTGNQLLRVKHSPNAKDVLLKIQQTMDLANKQFVATMDTYRFLAKSKIVNKNDLKEYVMKVLDITPDDNDTLSTRQANRVQQIVDLTYNGTGAEISQGTWWNAYNAVTEYLSHSAGRNEDNRYSSLWFGTGADQNRRALELAIQVAG